MPSLPVTEIEGKGEGKRAMALGRNMDAQTLFRFAHIQTEGAGHSTFHLFPCPQKLTACIMTSAWCRFAGGLSNKNAESYYFYQILGR